MSFKDKIHNFAYEYLQVQTETHSEIIAYCPYHKNTDTPSFSLNKNHGSFQCFNPACGAKGSLKSLRKHMGASGELVDDGVSINELEKLLSETRQKEDWDEALERVVIDYDTEIDKLQYLIDRGFDPEVLEYFEIGFSERQNRIVIPARDENYNLVGFIGRAIDNDRKPKYKYSSKFPRGGMLYNLCNAKRYNTGIIAEGSLDAIAIHAAGFPNVVSTLGANVTKDHLSKLVKYFDEIIIMSDKDEAGKSMECGIIEGAGKLNIWLTQFPEGAKDPGELTKAQIKEAIDGKINYLESIFHE